MAIVTSRDTARATTPSAQPNGLSVKSSPCATAATTGADARGGVGYHIREQLQTRANVGIGPRTPKPIVIDLVGGRQHV